jgi:hypothetical protein
MRNRTIIFSAAAALVGMLIFSGNTLAVRPPDKGPGEDPPTEVPDYGDLFIVYRDAGGVPILKEFDEGVSCLQPVAEAPWDDCETVPEGEHEGKCLVPVDPETCGVIAEYAIYTQEVDFGRINEARSSDEVFASQLEEVIINLSTSGCLDLDAAGRPVYSSLTDLGVVSGTVDSPLQSLAIYRELMKEGTLGGSVPLTWDPMDMAARALGAASDKAGKVTVDLIAYLNETMGLTQEDGSFLGRNCIMVTQEVMGVVRPVQQCFLDYSAFSYHRPTTFGALPDRPYIPGDEPQAGWFEYLYEEPLGSKVFYIGEGPITTRVFGDAEGFTNGDIGGFAQEADDARAVIQYMHNWPVPGEYETARVCDEAADTFYDVSISDVSGLQVPVRMVADTEGREGTVTVSNAGPADADVSLMVIGEYEGADGAETVAMLRVVDGVVTEDPIFEEAEVILLRAGRSASFVFFFSMDEATTIEWTATAEAEFDVNLDNNTVEAETVVRATKGGGGEG